MIGLTVLCLTVLSWFIQISINASLRLLQQYCKLRYRKLNYWPLHKVISDRVIHIIGLCIVLKLLMVLIWQINLHTARQSIFKTILTSLGIVHFPILVEKVSGKNYIYVIKNFWIDPITNNSVLSTFCASSSYVKGSAKTVAWLANSKQRLNPVFRSKSVNYVIR